MFTKALPKRNGSEGAKINDDKIFLRLLSKINS